MVKFIHKVVELCKSFILYKRCRRAIKEADRRLVQTGKKQLVLMYDGKPMVISKQQVKAKIRQGFFHKGFTPEKAESLAIYKTR